MVTICELLSNDLIEDENAKRITNEIGELANLLASHEFELTVERLRWIINSGTTIIFVVKDNDKIVGMISLCLTVQLTTGKAWGEDLILLDEYRHRGIGRLLLIEIINRAKEYGVTKLDVTTSYTRLASLHNCFKLGWKKRASYLLRLNPQDWKEGEEH